MDEQKFTHTVLLHGLKYDAYTTEENEDGSLEMMGVAINNGQLFPISRARKAPADTSKVDPAVPFWVRRAEPKPEPKPEQKPEQKP